jgi:hypothetical protein
VERAGVAAGRTDRLNHRIDQLLRRKRLADQPGRGLGDHALEALVLGMTADQHHGQPRATLAQAPRQFRTAELGHHDVRNQRVDRRLGHRIRRQRLLAVARLDDREAGAPQGPRRNRAHALVVLGKEHTTATRPHGTLRSRISDGRHLRDRQHHRKSRTVALGTLDVDPPAKTCHDAVHRREA